jgi:hypothetical protein
VCWPLPEIRRVDAQPHRYRPVPIFRAVARVFGGVEKDHIPGLLQEVERIAVAALAVGYGDFVRLQAGFAFRRIS